MKNKKIIAVILTLVVILFAGACKKNRFCYCISESYETVASNGDTTLVADTVVVNIDRGMKCENIYEMGIEELVGGEPQISTREFDCIEIETEDTVVTTIPIDYSTPD